MGLLIAASTKGVEYIIALVGLAAFLLFLRILKTPEEKDRPQEGRHGSAHAAK